MSVAIEMPVVIGSATAQPSIQRRASHITALWQLEEVFELRQRKQTLAFLLREQHLIDWLLACRPQIDSYFGAEIEVILEAIDDPDVLGRNYLAAYLYTNKPVEEALEQLERFEDGWLYPRLGELGDRIVFNLRWE